MERARRTSLNSNLLAEDSFTKIACMTVSDQSTETAGMTRTIETALIFESGGTRAALPNGMDVTLLHAGLAFDRCVSSRRN